MVQIFLKLGEDPKEWSIVELQGTLESSEEELCGSHIGNLHFDDKGTPQLICGHHLVTGKIQKLDKPYAVMKKNSISHGMSESMEIDDSDGQSTAYDIVAFVKQKIIFKNRPKPIIIKTQPTKT
ncbi:chromosome transmission fidelity protein 8 homolog [Clytia hemisphaerica]|uniref:Chromosome transmission fidelity protein 8 n=1 Tax=Clytia hemisphaerica TaxID=252671 RepID=A0A7M5V586_9CNID|eukprot:TCONS_00067200-protein